PEEQIVNGKKVEIHNRDGIDLRQGCKNFRIHNISGKTEDDFIALSNLDTDREHVLGGGLESTMVTSTKWYGLEDDIEQIAITNIHCESNTRAIAIRGSGSAGVHHIYMDGIIAKTRHNALLIG